MVDWQLSILDPERSCPEEQNGTVVSDESEWIQGYMDRHLIDSGDAELDKGERDEPNAVAGSNYITPTALLVLPLVTNQSVSRSRSMRSRSRLLMTSIILMICLTRTTERSSECWSPVTPLWHMPDPQMWPRCVVAEYDDRSDEAQPNQRPSAIHSKRPY